MSLNATLPADQLRELAARLAIDDDFHQVCAALHAGDSVMLDAVCGSSCALATAAVSHAESFDTILVILSDGQLVDTMVSDLAIFSPHAVLTFPTLDMISGRSALIDDAYGDRLRLLKKLVHGENPRFLVTSIQALQQPVPEAAEIANQTRKLRCGMRLDVEELATWLVKHQYHHTSAVELPGEFSIRGGIVDLFATDWLDPVRLEMFDDEVESMRRFDWATQRSLMPLDNVEITVLARQTSRTSHLAEYLPKRTGVVVRQPDEVIVEGKQFLERVPDSERLHAPDTVFQSLAMFPQLSAWMLAPTSDMLTIRLAVETVDRFQGDVSQIRDYLEFAGKDHEVYVVCQTEAEAERLGELFGTTQLAELGKLHFPIGRLQSGFRLRSENWLILSGAELFGRTDLRRVTRKRAGKAIDSFLDLQEGDLVVHLGHGIGRYRGLKLLEKADQAEEHLEIEFHGGTKVYVPAARIELVQKYIGGRKAIPRLAKIGGKQWQKQREAAASAATDLAAEMLDLQAEREAQAGIAMSKDTDWQHEFDASFPYQETPDQLTAIEAIKQDLTAARAMDRLLCGDVGFGKTEVAMRAAFKAIDNGYQVAVLVPTTILAEQHFLTFKQRMAEFPFHIAKLSRFATGSEQKKVVEEVAKGQVDIVIGTHRIASKDVTFENLGLLIIDEEQRFGVAVKDRLKTLRASVNVLTLSATPIPRTLHMALTGIRGISNLETPPEDRLAVETRVTRWDDEIIRHAVMRERSRNGQIYFVHNRVHDIEKVRDRLLAICPEISIIIGHGQMPEGELEQVMIDFIGQKYDMLLATTIIESGLDIPNANTIFIDDANNYGLADLHQLRGRVGRYRHRAYCYLLVDPARSLTPDATRRLRAIEEYSNMGAGFAIAMRDLEIRGAGNILGTQQSGHIATVGYELYCQLLETAVRRLRNLPSKLQVDVTIELPGKAYLPRDYVPDLRAKVDLYRRLARTFNPEDLSAIREELIDRFGPLPDAADRLLAMVALKSELALWQLHSLHLEKPYLVFGYGDRSRAEQLARNSRNQLRIVDDASIYATLPNKGELDPDTMIAFAQQLLGG